MRAVTAGLVAAVAVVLAGGPAAGQDGKDAKIDAALIVGKWTPKEAEGKDFVVEFTKDGKMVFAASGGGKEFKIEGTYKLAGNKLTLAMKLGDLEKTETRTVHSLSKTELVSSDEKGKKDTLVRVAAKKEK